MSLVDAHGQRAGPERRSLPGDRDDVIDQHLPAGTYYLRVEDDSGAGTYNLAVTLTPSAPTSETVSTPFSPSFVATGDCNRDGITDLAVASTFMAFRRSTRHLAV